MKYLRFKKLRIEINELYISFNYIYTIIQNLEKLLLEISYMFILDSVSYLLYMNIFNMTLIYGIILIYKMVIFH